MITLMMQAVFLDKIIASGPEETFAVGEYIATLLYPGTVVALRGGLGAGKTVLVKGIASRLGITETVTSPTYTIVSVYETAAQSLYHIDAYRLSGESDFSNIGADEFLYGDGITVIEWADHVASLLPKDTLFIDIEIQEDGKRLITVSGALKKPCAT
ncbi:tRNA (adenosine(37)-N6)-threonylcarbamoyltransferase complex ATPase subunit type 1 TsaE [Breznakiellaceae bacterium SP9]